MTDSNIELPFGKYKGKRLGDVPASYLLWLGDQDWVSKFPLIEQYIKSEWQYLEKEAKEEG